MQKVQLIEYCGWVGVALFVSAYYMLSTNRLSSKSHLFHVLNILGSFGLIINAFYYSDHPNLLVNVIWMIIGLTSIVRNLVEANGKTKQSG